MNAWVRRPDKVAAIRKLILKASRIFSFNYNK